MANIETANILKAIVILGTTISFLWGVIKYLDSKKVESTRPFLEKQLSLYSEATRTAAIISTTGGKEELDIAKIKFWRLYWGELAMVENKGVEAAMKAFGDALIANSNTDILKGLSLDLAKACRYSLDKSWGINAWSNPDEASKTAK